MSSASRAAPMKLAADALDKGYSMAWLKMISRSALCGIVGVAALVSEAADLTLGSVAQPKRGEVIARVSYVGSGALQPAALSIRLDADHSVPAASVASAPAVAAPVALLLCLDRSGSMGAPAIGAMQSALRESLAAPGGAASLSFSVAIFAFATRTTPLLNLTNDPARVDAAVANLVIEKERDGKTRLYDAVAGGLAELRASDVASKRLIVVSDGDDEGSHITQAELVKRATSTAIPVDAIGFGALAASRSGSLATIAGATGGSFQVAANNAELTAALGRMIRRTVPAVQYDVTFRYGAAEAGMSESPKLVFKPTTGAAAESPIQVGLAAASGTSVLANVAASGSTPTDITPSGWRALINLTAIQRFAERVPLFAWIGLGVFLLLLIALLLILWRRRHVFAVPASGPKAGPPFLSPPAAVIGPTRTSVSDDPNLPAPPGRPGDRHTVVSFRWPSPGDGRVIAILHIVAGPTAGRRIEITAAKVSVGSALKNDLVLEADDFVSSYHAVLRAEANGLYLVDLGATNGTELNGTRFKGSTRSLSPGDRVTLGRTTFEVRAADGPQARHPAFEQRVR